MTLSLRSLAVCALLCVLTQIAAAAQPNILFVMTDDQAPWALGLSMHPHARTPHQDKLFREGARLLNSFVVTPVCSPSRTSLITGRYGSEFGITDWINPRKEADLGLDPEAITWPQLFADAGYSTGLIGKWHLGTQDRFHPTVFGYQYFMGFRGGGNRPIDPTLEVDGKSKKLNGLLPDILTDDAIEFLQRNQKRPFMLSLHYRAPHSPWLPVADEDWAPFKDLDPILPEPDYPKLDIPRVKKMTREYLASTTSVDRNLGRLMAEVDRLGLRDNTIVIYTSDHGYNMGHNGIFHKGNGHYVLTEPPPATENIPRGQRPNMFDHSIRVPTAVRWPGVIKPATTITGTVANIDWFPTLLSMAGIDVPNEATLRGRNVTPLLTGKLDGVWQNGLFGQYSTHHQSRTHMRMYRTPEWKLVRDFLNPERDELYNLKDDPAENHNLIRSEDPAVQEMVVKLHIQIVRQMSQIGDSITLPASTD